MNELLRGLPQTSVLLESEHATRLIVRYSREEVVEAVRNRLQALRSGLRRGEMSTLPDFSDAAFFAPLANDIDAGRRANLRRVINATGIILHTNLGRSRLAPQALAAVHRAGEDYSNLELNLDSGARGSRHDLVEGLLCSLTGAEAAIVVNNCAAAVLLCLTSLARDREVIASRGELIEIGGSFRLPDVIAQCGARLREVGSTNRTYLNDYERAVGPDTAILLKSHTSNFRIIGFTAAPTRRALADLAHRLGLVMLEDLGSGALVDLAPYGLPDETVVASAIAEGADLVTFSGDKLLGGPQAGIIAGRRDLVSRLKSHPLARAVRIDKLSLAALEATLRLYLPPHDPMESVPTLRALAQTAGAIKARASSLLESLEALSALKAELWETTSMAGGGSLPSQDLPSVAVALKAFAFGAEMFAGRLRAGAPSVLGRIQDGRVLLDMRTVRDTEVADIVSAVSQVMAG